MAEDRVTIDDVAAEAGVSTGTVSAVLNNRSTVRERTRRRVLHTMEALEYEPSPAARNLGGGGSNRDMLERGVGMVIKEMDNPFYTEVVMGAKELFEEQGYIVFTCASEGSYRKEGDLIKAFRNRFVDGLIVAPLLGEQVDLSHLFMLRRAGYPFVLLENVPGLQAHAVSVDNVETARMATSYLIERGHERIVHFAGPRYTQHTRDRIAGVEKAFSQSNLRFTDEVVVRAGAHFQDGYATAISYFGEGHDALPTAVTCFNDLVAMGVLRGLAECGLRVPEDVSVIGFDDIPSASYLSPPLTTVRVPKREMGRQAARRLLTVLEAEDEPPPEHVVLGAELVERASTRSL